MASRGVGMSNVLNLTFSTQNFNICFTATAPAAAVPVRGSRRPRAPAGHLRECPGGHEPRLSEGVGGGKAGRVTQA